MRIDSGIGRFAPAALVLGVLTAWSLGPAGPAAAQPGRPNEYAKIILHLAPAGEVGGNVCTSSKGLKRCNDMITAGKLFPDTYYAYLCVTDAERDSGIAGLQCGIDYNGAKNRGVDVFDWKLCATMQFPQPAPAWPAAGGGNIITWDGKYNCQRNEPGGAGTGVLAVAGYFYLAAYSADRMSVTVRPVDGLAKVATCNAVEAIVEGGTVHFPKSHLGYVEFSENGDVIGYNPCGTNKPVEKKTWGEVKADPNGH